MKKIYLIILLFLFSSITYAQKIMVSPEMNVRDDKSFTLIGLVKNKILTFRNRESKYILNIFDDQLNRTIEKKLSFEKKKINILSVTSNEDNWVLVYSYRNKNDEIINAIRYDHYGVKLDSARLISKEYSFLSKKFVHSVSEDENKLILFRNIDKNQMEFISIDLKFLNTTASEIIEFKGINLYKDFRKIEVTNKGNFFLLYEKRANFFTRSKHRIKLFSISNDLSIIHEKEIKLNFQSNGVKMKFDNKNKVLNIASIITKSYTNKTKGYYLCKLDEVLNKKIEITRNYNNRFLNNYYNLRSKKPKSYIKSILLKDIVLRNDGGVLFFLERKEVISRRDYDRGVSRRRSNSFHNYNIDYLYEDLALIALHNDGSEFWSKIIMKAQISANDSGIYSSFFIFQNPSKLKLIFNDEIKDENQIIMYSVNPLGETDRQSIFSTDLYNLKIAFTKSVQISNRRMVVPSYKKDKLKLVLIDF